MPIGRSEQLADVAQVVAARRAVPEGRGGEGGGRQDRPGGGGEGIGGCGGGGGGGETDQARQFSSGELYVSSTQPQSPTSRPPLLAHSQLGGKDEEWKKKKEG